MNAPLLFSALIAALPPASQQTLRYGLVIGTDLGSDATEGSLPPLLHAEREARRLRERLLGCCLFEGDRMWLLERPSLAQVSAAIENIAEKMNADARANPKAKMLFAFFFTGHGLNGRLLLRDGALGRDDLAAMLR